MTDKVRVGPVILLVISIVVALVGVGLCRQPMQNEDFSSALFGAFLLLVSAIGVLTGSVWWLRSRRNK